MTRRPRRNHTPVCVPNTSSVLLGSQNRVTFLDHVCSVLVRRVFLALPFKSKSGLEAENAALRHQLIVLRRKVRGRVRLAKLPEDSPCV